MLLLPPATDAAVRATARRTGCARASAGSGTCAPRVGPVVLRASTGVVTGDVHLVLAGDPSAHRELMVLGPVATG